MLGFDSYIPSKWLDGIFAIHLTENSHKTKSTTRHGRWAAKSMLTTVLFAGSSIAATTALAHDTSQTLLPVLKTRAAPVRHVSKNAPPGYMESLKSATSRAVRLPEQSTESDPPFQF